MWNVRKEEMESMRQRKGQRKGDTGRQRKRKRLRKASSSKDPEIC